MNRGWGSYTLQDLEQAQCELVDTGLLNSIIAGYVVLALKRAEADVSAIMAEVFDTYDARAALDALRGKEEAH